MGLRAGEAGTGVWGSGGLGAGAEAKRGWSRGGGGQVQQLAGLALLLKMILITIARIHEKVSKLSYDYIFYILELLLEYLLN